jgi:hypothetical protein
MSFLLRTPRSFPVAHGSGTGVRRAPPRAWHSTQDVRELIEHEAKAVVLSIGIWQRLKVCPETLELLAENHIQVEVLQTETR